jgi:hypothetical protein
MKLYRSLAVVIIAHCADVRAAKRTAAHSYCNWSSKENGTAWKVRQQRDRRLITELIGAAMRMNHLQMTDVAALNRDAAQMEDVGSTGRSAAHK